MSALIGRESERKILSQLLNSSNAELAVLYGRRRVGKTYLVRTYFKDKCEYIEFTGIQKGNLSRQLAAFSEKLSKNLFNGIPIEKPNNWHEAFSLLSQGIEKIHSSKKIVVFFDELPWMVSRKSNLLQEFDHFWNTRWSLMQNIKIILCGSAASWMIDNIVNSKGGLHNRLTKRMLLAPFDLTTTKKYLESIGLKYTLPQITELYMVTGGVPYYLNSLSKDKSIQQNIDGLCFNKTGLLHDEFARLFESLYEQAEINLKIIRGIAKYREGISRKLLIEEIKIASGGSLNKRIQELEAAGFIKSFTPYGKESRDVFYRVIDEYCLFYLKWVQPTLGQEVLKGYWQNTYHTPAWYEWAGYAFENICVKHLEKIRQALDLQYTGCTASSWKFIPKRGDKSSGAQIDLLFDRDDGVITLFEIKYSDSPYKITKEYARALIQKIDVFHERTKSKKQLMLAFIAANGIKENLWSEDLIQATVTLEDLF